MKPLFNHRYEHRRPRHPRSKGWGHLISQMAHAILDMTPIANWNLTPRALSSAATLSVMFAPESSLKAAGSVVGGQGALFFGQVEAHQSKWHIFVLEMPQDPTRVAIATSSQLIMMQKAVMQHSSKKHNINRYRIVVCVALCLNSHWKKGR